MRGSVALTVGGSWRDGSVEGGDRWAPRQVDLTRPVTIGRSRENDVRLPDAAERFSRVAAVVVVDYDLSRDYHRFLAAVGPDDEADRAARVRVEVIVDRETVQTYELGFDETASIDLDVTGALRLQLRATLLEPDGQCVSSAAAVLADPRLLGVPWELEAG